MKIAFDVDVIKDLGITRMVHQVAEWGYKYIEQSPHPQISRSTSTRPRQPEDHGGVQAGAARAGLELSSFICVYPWSGPDELRRQAAVKKLETAGGNCGGDGRSGDQHRSSPDDPNQPEICDEMFYRSMEELFADF